MGAGGAGNTTTGAGNGLFGNTNAGRRITGANFGAAGRSGTSGTGASKVACSTMRRTSGDAARTVPKSTITKPCNRILKIKARREGAAGTVLKINLHLNPQYTQ
jgi:hypothetical protein